MIAAITCPVRYPEGTTMRDMNWQFPRNLTNAPIGPRDRGIEHYTGRRFDSLVREIIQNSLDAQDKDTQAPAKVDFRMTELEVTQFNGSELATAIDASIAGIRPEDEAYRKMFGKAAAQLRQDTIPTLVITDSNTTGVLDDGNDNSPWAALTRGSGESAKQGNNASGSYGIGKAAAYLATDLRTVLYTTAFAVNGHLESRFIGRAILSGHKNPQGEKVTSEGYLGGLGFASLHNEDIPALYRLQQPGLCLRIPGYQAAKDWPERVVKIAIANFFHAIVKGELEVAVADRTISKQTVGGYANLLSVRERHLLNTAGKIPVAQSCIEGIGEVALRVALHDAGDGNIHDVALVRDAGMMITRERSKMGPARITIPGHWHRFTAIVECRSDPTGKSAVRDCESPKHDELDIDRIPNDEDRGPARKALHELRDWMKEEIRKQAEPVSNTEPVNAAEAAELLPVRGLNNDPNRRPQPGGDSISEPVQRGTATPVTSPPPPPPPPPPGDPKPHQPPQPPAPPKPQVIVQHDVLAKAKFRIGGRSDTHGLTVQIPPFAKRIRNVQIQAVTEHGGDIAMKIAGIWSNGKELKVSRGKIAGIAPNGRDPVTLEINLQEPVAGRRFRIRTATPRE